MDTQANESPPYWRVRRTKTLGVIPARGGSKGIPQKNLYQLCGKPLIRWTVDAALQSSLTHIVVTTDSGEIAAACSELRRIYRSEDLANDEAPMLPVVRHAVYESAHSADAVVVLQPTSPLRTAADIDHCINMLEEGDSVVSVTAGVHPVKLYGDDCQPIMGGAPYDKHRHRCWVRNGAVFALKMSVLDSGRLWTEAPLLYRMPKTRSVDVDDMEDMIMAEALIRAGVLR